MLLQNLLNHPELTDFLCDECRENEVGVRFSNAILPSDYLIIKIDEYFRTYIRERIPAGIDCLIVQRCANDDYKLYLVELKKITDLRGYNLNHIRSKFQNCFDLFMSDKFRDFFYDLSINFTSIQLIFVSTTNENKNRKDKYQKNTRLDALLSMRPCRFANKFRAISFEEPDPLVVPC
jgi:hypothetical protein